MTIFIVSNPLCRWMAMAWLLLVSTGLTANGEPVVAQSVVLQLLDEADLAAGQSGIVVELNVREGQSVKRGEVLARIDDTAAKIAEQGAQAELALATARSENDVAVRAAEAAQRVAEAELARSEDSIARFPKSVSQSQIDVERLSIDKLKLEVEAGRTELRLAELAQQVAERKLAAAQLEIRRRKIVAPIDAMAVAVESAVGEWVEPGQKMVRLVSTTRLKAEGFISADQATRAPLGSEVQVQVDGGPTVEGLLKFVSPEVDPINKQVRIWAEVANPDGQLRPGQQVSMQLPAAQSDEEAEEANE